MTVPDEGFQIRKLPIPDDAVVERLATTSQRKLADELGVSRRAVRLAADRHRAMQARVAAGELAVRDRERRERRRAKRQGRIAPASRAPENGPPAAAGSGSRSRRNNGGRVLRPILLDENFCAVDAIGRDGIGPAWWLNERDAMNRAAADPRRQREELEAHRQRVAAETGLRWNPLANDGHGAFTR